MIKWLRKNHLIHDWDVWTNIWDFHQVKRCNICKKEKIRFKD